MKRGDSLRAVSELEPGDHLCCLYETEADHRAVLTPFLRQGLEQGEKVLYVVDARTAEIVLDYLRDDGLDVLPYLASGQLKILTADLAYTQGGAFSPDRMVDMLSQETQRALQEGYRALRVTGEMSWALRGLPGSDRLIEYEARLNEFFPNHPALGLCQYDQRRFAPDVLLNVLRTHPMAIVGQVVYDNFYYVPPDEMLGEHLPSVELHHWLVSLAERKQAQQEIESLARFPSENPNPVLRLNRDGLILYANAASQALLTEWSRAQGDYAPVFWQDLVARSLANPTGASVDVECGEQVYSLMVAPVAGAGYVNLYGTDITARKRAAEALQRRNRELALLNRAGQELTSTLDPHHVLEQFLRAVAEMIVTEGSSVWLLDDEQPGRLVCQASTCPGSKRSPVGLYLKIGQGVVGWVAQNGKCALVPSAPDDPRFSPEIDELIGFRTTSLLAVPLCVRDDVIGVLEVVNKLSGELNDDDSNLLETLAVAAAIAIENARLIETLRQRTDELLARNQELDTFAHTAAHDLKTPLSLIVGYAGLMKDDPQAVSDELRHTLQAITRNARKMSHIIDDLLLLAEVRSADMRLEPIFMPAVLAEVQERLALDIREYQAEIVMPETTAWPAAWGYAPWVEEVWANYMSNALKYGGRPPRVELGAMPLAEGQVRFWVRDNGLGLSPEDQARLFLPFAKLGQARAKGHGLGLSIVRRIVEKLGGEVGVESRVGQGSVFSFTLPSVPV
jgi:signal transduction histidine kinase/PAS domain-containing protein